MFKRARVQWGWLVLLETIHQARLRSAAAALALMSMLPSAVHAQYVVAEGIAAGGYSWSRSWVDINGDGRDDFCEIAGGSGEQLRCYLSNGTTFGPTSLTFSVPASTGSYSVRWMDINGDGKPDLCRTYGASPGVGESGGLTCRLAPGFTAGPNLQVPLYHRTETRFTGGDRGEGLIRWELSYTTDVNADGLTDFCYLHKGSLNTVRCLLSNGAGFDVQASAWISRPVGVVSDSTGFFDFNGDGFPDFCRLGTAAVVKCLLGGPNGFTTTDVTSPAIDIPYKEGAAFVDVNGDGKTDFCRIVGPSGSFALSCLVSNGVGWQATELTSPVIPDSAIGHQLNRWWVDINGDGMADYCRTSDAGSGFWRIDCRLSRGDGDGTSAFAFGFSDVSVSTLFDGFTIGVTEGRSFCDAVGNGIPTYCRVTANAWAPRTETHSSPIDGSVTSYSVPTNSIGLRAGMVDPAFTPFQLAQARSPLLTSYSDGLGAETQINYLPMTRPEVYVRSGTGSFPRALIVQPRSPVVFETRAWRTASGASAALTGIARYSFKDLRNDNWAGSRGFRERWIFTEGSNTLDHIVNYQGLGPGVDPSSVLDDSGEIGLVKYQERYAVANGYLPTPTITPATPSARTSLMKNAMSAATLKDKVLPTPPSGSSPFLLLQSTTNTLSTLNTPDNRPYRYISASEVKSYDWNGNTIVVLPQVNTSTVLVGQGNVSSLSQTTTAVDGSTWTKNTSNTYSDNLSAWILGRLTASTVTSTSPNADAQIAAAGARSAGASPTASDMSSGSPTAPQPLSPAVLAAILQLLLED